jgi:hypothetical protein
MVAIYCSEISVRVYQTAQPHIPVHSNLSLTGVFGSKKEEVGGNWRQLHNVYCGLIWGCYTSL